MDLANRIAEKLSAVLGYSDEQCKVIAYGLGAAIQMLELFLISIIFGIFFNCAIECIIVFLGVGLLRRTTGGGHCMTYMACILTSSLSIILMALFARYLIPGYLPKWMYMLFGFLPGFACIFATAYKRVPQASRNKPISNPVKIKRLRRQCFATLCIYMVIAVLLLVFDWGNGRNISSFCALILVLYWQCFTLTSWSGRLAGAMDRLFTNETN